MNIDEGSSSTFPAEGKTLASVEVPRLQRGALGLVDIATSTMANIAPAMSFFFSSALIAQAAGIASPLIIVAAAIAIALLGNTLAEFSRAIPSTGSFITFIGKTFGPLMAVTTTIVVSIGYIVAMASVINISGGWTQIILQRYIGINVPWQILTLLFVALVFFLMVRGVHLSTRWAGYFFVLEMAVLLLVSIVVLVTNGAHLSLAPFNPLNIAGGVAGFGFWVPDSCVHVHRLGKLRVACGGDHRSTEKCSQGYLREHPADGSLLPAIYVRYGGLLQLQRQRPVGSTGSVHYSGGEDFRYPGAAGIYYRFHIDHECHDRRIEFASPPDL